VQQSSDILSITKEQIALQIRDKNLAYYITNQHLTIKKGQGKETYLSTDSMQYLQQLIKRLRPSKNITILPTITKYRHYSVCRERLHNVKDQTATHSAKPWLIDNFNRTDAFLSRGTPVCSSSKSRILEAIVIHLFEDITQPRCEG
jgi:hypothetical protein